MNIVHGDLRGANILVSDEGNACVADFGLASVFEAPSTEGALIDTSSANPAGSARWFAPELIQPTSVGCKKFKRTPASDVYAFACVCLEVTAAEYTALRWLIFVQLYTGRPPFSDTWPDVAAMLKVIAGDRPARDPSMSDGFWDLVTAAWPTWSQ
jgi:serine/threonine protein kinase